MSYCGETGDIIEMRRTHAEFSIEWQIHDFFALSSRSGDHYTSRHFMLFDAQWYFRLFTNGLLQMNKPSEWVNLIFSRVDSGLPKTLNIKIEILGVHGVENKKEIRQEFSENDRAFCWFRFSTRSDLRNKKSEMTPGNSLKIRCDMKCDIPRATRNSSSQTDEKFSETEVVTEDKKLSGIEKLSEDLGKLMTGDENSDITLQVGDVEFKVHRAILSVRSPVLAAMLRHETEERASNNIKINDCEPDVFGDFLHYIYKGSFQFITEKNVFGLYRIADMYFADDLKQKCLQYIRNTLSIQTFCHTVKLALTHGESDLLELAVNFATENTSLLICSIEWQNFNCENPRQANEILIKCLGPRN